MAGVSTEASGSTEGAGSESAADLATSYRLGLEALLRQSAAEENGVSMVETAKTELVEVERANSETTTAEEWPERPTAKRRRQEEPERPAEVGSHSQDEGAKERRERWEWERMERETTLEQRRIRFQLLRRRLELRNESVAMEIEKQRLDLSLHRARVEKELKLLSENSN